MHASTSAYPCTATSSNEHCGVAPGVRGKSNKYGCVCGYRYTLKETLGTGATATVKKAEFEDGGVVHHRVLNSIVPIQQLGS